MLGTAWGLETRSDRGLIGVRVEGGGVLVFSLISSEDVLWCVEESVGGESMVGGGDGVMWWRRRNGKLWSSHKAMACCDC